LAVVDPLVGEVFLRKDKPETVGDKAVRAALRYRFAGARLPQDVSPLKPVIPLSPEKDVQQTVQLLAEAKRPVFVLGSQSAAQPGKIHELAKALKDLGAPVFLGGMSRGLLGRDCPNFIRQNRGLALAKSDLVILVGSVVDFRLSYGKVLPKQDKAKIVAVSRDQEHLDLNRTLYAELAGMGWRAALASLGDPCNFVLRVAAASKGGRFSDWTAELKAAEAKKEAGNVAQGEAAAFGRGEFKEQQLINPISMLHQLEELLPDNAILVADGGDFVATAAYIVRPRSPLSWLDPGQFGTLGVGGGFALGAKLANPDAEVWLLWGDGAAGYSIAEFDTMNRHGANVIALIGNDACWGQIERDQTNWFGSSVSCDLEYTKYEMVAEGFGGRGMCLRSPEEVVSGFEDARRRAKEEGKPVLINALIGRTKFREGSISA
jgi:acetolactate synthase-like protein